MINSMNSTYAYEEFAIHHYETIDLQCNVELIYLKEEFPFHNVHKIIVARIE